MGRVIDYTARTAADLDGTEVTYLSDGGSYKIAVGELMKYASKTLLTKPVDQGTITALPTSLPVTAGARNVFWVNTSGGSIDLSALGTLGGGIAAGQSVIFRKTTRDDNRVKYSHTAGGSLLTETSYASLYQHYVDDHSEIELIFDGATWQVVSMPQNDYGLDMTGATDSRAAFHELLVDYTGKILVLPPGRIKLDGVAAGGSYPNGALQIPAGTTLIGDPLGTEIYCDTPSGAQYYLNFNNNVTMKDINVTLNPACTRTATVKLLRLQAVSGIKMTNCIISGGGQLQNDLILGTGNIQAYQSSNCSFEKVTFRWARNSLYGAEFIGCVDFSFIDCLFTENGADGVKAFADGTNGECKNLRFHNCTFSYNGQSSLQLPDSTKAMATATYTGAITLPITATGDRYRLNLGTSDDITLPASTNTGKYVFVARQIASAGVPTVKVASGTLTGLNAAANALPIDRISTPYNYPSATIKLTEVSGGWTAVEWVNGEGFDGHGLGVTFTDCKFNNNQGYGCQIKPGTATYGAADCLHTNCIAQDNWGGGFGVVNANYGLGAAPPTNIMYTSCSAIKNYDTGFSFVTEVIDGITMGACVIRSNGSGLGIHPQCRNVVVSNCQFHGNYNPTRAFSDFNITVDAATNVTITDCILSGVDPIRQNLQNITAIDNTGNAEARGMFIRKTNGAYTLTRLKINDCTYHNHASGVDKAYFTTGGTSATVDDFTATNLIETGYPRLQKILTIPLSGAMVWDSSVQLPETPAADDLGLYQGAYGNNGMLLTAGNARLLSSTRYARYRIVLPPDYEAARPVTVRVVAYSDGAICNTSLTVDATLWYLATNAVGTIDVVNVGPTSVNTTTPNTVDFTCTPTNLVPGHELELRLALIYDCGTNNAYPRITRVQLLY